MRSVRDAKSAPIVPKVVVLYAKIFEIPTDLPGNVDAFYNELLLMKPRAAVLSDMLAKLSCTQLIVHKSTLNTFFGACVRCTCADNGVRIVNSLHTLGALIAGVCAHGAGHDRLDALIGIADANRVLKLLIERLCELLEGDYLKSVKHAVVHCLKAMVVANEAVNANAFIEYLMTYSVFDTLTTVLASNTMRKLYGNDALVILTILVNYRKYDNVNPYIVNLSILDHELALNGYSQVIAHALHSYNQQYRSQSQASQSTGVMSGVTNWLGNMFVLQQYCLGEVKVDETLLLAMYEVVHLNRNFMTMLTSSVSLADPFSHTKVVPPSPTTPPPSTTAASITSTMSSDDDTESRHSHDALSSSTTVDVNGAAAVVETPINLMSTFITYCSLVLHDLKSEESRQSAKLCAIILTCVTEDQLANTLMHDVTLALRVPLYRVPMRHRAGAFDSKPQLWPLACSLLDLCQEFITSHLMKQLPFELFLSILGVIHRVVVYQRRFRVRLLYNWRQLWNALISLLKFVCAHETHLSKEYDIFVLCHRVLALINLFITFGDTFLPSPIHYDHLYYEIIRNGSVFDSLHVMVNRRCQQSPPTSQSSPTNEHRSSDDSTVIGRRSQAHQSTQRCANQLINVRAIVNCIRPALKTTNEQSLTEQQVLDVVRTKYDSLTLRLYENLDVVQPYNERLTQSTFFARLLKRVVNDAQQRGVNSSAKKPKTPVIVP